MSQVRPRAGSENGDDSSASGQFAAAAAATWLAIDAALAPIIGRRGVVTLYQRSVHRAAMSIPGLLVVRDDAMHPGNFGPLQALLGALPITDAKAANDALLQNFHDLLASLIGSSLTERLLGPVSAPLQLDAVVAQHRTS